MKKEQITFKKFINCNPSSDYIYQDMDYEEQIEKAASLIDEAEYVLIGAGAGMSTAAGALYGGNFFKEHFKEFRQKYGEDDPYMQDMYSAGFYPYPNEEAFWGYWSKQALLGGINLDITPLHKELLAMLKDKAIFCLSTNADGQFVKAGLPQEKIFCTQGDYFHIQCAHGCHQKVYDAVNLFREMDQKRKDCSIPSYLVPKCPVCGGPMNMNLRIDDYFVEDETWHQAEERFGDFLSKALNSKKKLCLLELGVGFNTPTIIRFPFENILKNHAEASLIRLNLNEAVIPKSLQDRAVGINADIKQTIYDIKNTTLGKCYNKRKH